MVSGESARPLLVYLDQSVWSTWAKQQYTQDAMGRLARLANERRFLFVLSNEHLAETAKYTTKSLNPVDAEKKLAQARFIGSFPNLVALRWDVDLLAQEIAREYAKSNGRQILEDPPPFGDVGDFAAAAAAALESEAGYVPSGWLEWRRTGASGRGSLGASSYASKLTTKARMKARDAAIHDVETAHPLMARIQRGLQNRVRIRSPERIRSWADSMATAVAHRKPALAYTLATRQLGMPKYLGYTPSLSSLFAWAWRHDFSANGRLAFRFEYERILDEDPWRRPDRNDASDTTHAFAAAYVDVLVHEAFHAEIARKATKAVRASCSVFSGKPKARDFERAVNLVESKCLPTGS